jgi:hypothetical protein
MGSRDSIDVHSFIEVPQDFEGSLERDIFQGPCPRQALTQPRSGAVFFYYHAPAALNLRDDEERRVCP